MLFAAFVASALQALLVLCSTDAAAVKGFAFPGPYRRIAQDLTLRLQWKRLQVAHAVKGWGLRSGGTRMHA